MTFGTAKADAIIEALSDLVLPLTAALGSGTELVLHDLRHMDHSVVAIAGGVTDRKVGAPVTGLVLEHLQSGRSDHLLRYRTKTDAGRDLRSSTIFVRDDTGTPFACLCINTDITSWLIFRDEAEKIVGTYTDSIGEVEESRSEEFLPTVEKLVASAVTRAIAEVGVPVELMRKEHRTEVIKRLDAWGIFLVKDAVLYVASALQISRHSIYYYLRELSGGTEGSDGQSRTKPMKFPSSVSNQDIGHP